MAKDADALLRKREFEMTDDQFFNLVGPMRKCLGGVVPFYWITHLQCQRLEDLLQDNLEFSLRRAASRQRHYVLVHWPTQDMRLLCEDNSVNRRMLLDWRNPSPAKRG